MLKLIQHFKYLQHEPINNYSPGLNSIKGLLVLAVIFGHSLNINSNFQAIYFFHMPLFLAISGFLVKKSAFENGIISFLKKLMNRAFIPWLIAFSIYIPVTFYQQSITSFSIQNIIYPYYHLWYVPAYIIGTIVCFSAIKFKIPSTIMLLFTALLIVAYFLIYRNSTIQVTDLPLYYLGDKRFYSYLFFFFFGFAIRNYLVKIRPNALLLIILILVSAFLVLYIDFRAKQFNNYIVIPYLILNTCLIFFIVIYSSSQNWTTNKFIHFLNTQSLGIYLYHYLFIFAAYQLLNDPKMNKLSTITGTFIFIGTVILTSILVWLLTQFNVTNKYVLGNIKK